MVLVGLPSLVSWLGSAASLQGGEIGGAGSAFDCVSGGSEDWPDVQRRLFRLLDGSARGDALSSELTAASTSPFPGQGDCVPGQVSLRMLLLLTGSGMSAAEAGAALQVEWEVLGDLGWPRVIATGWPVFRLMRLLSSRAAKEGSDGRRQPEAVPGCGDEEPYLDMLIRHVRHRRGGPDESLLAASAAYLAARGSSGGCTLSVAAAFLAPSWRRFPVFDAETEDALRLAEPLVRHLSLESVLSTRHVFLDMLDDIASVYQAFIIDSGALYVDLRQKDGDEEIVDYTRHMMKDGDEEIVACGSPDGRTPLGRCNPFAPLGAGMAPWRRGGVSLDDTERALRAARGREHVVLLRLLGRELVALAPPGAPDAVTEAVECLAGLIQSAITKSELARFDIVVHYGGSPLLRKPGGGAEHRAPQGRRQDVPAPVFGFCASAGHWDIPLPRACGLACVADVDADGVEAAAQDRQLVPVPAAGEDDGTAVDCYMWRLLVSYSEMMRYQPSHGQIGDDMARYVHTWMLPHAPPEEEAEAFTTRCEQLMKAAAQ